jgi:hypothetical protein
MTCTLQVVGGYTCTAKCLRLTVVLQLLASITGTASAWGQGILVLQVPGRDTCTACTASAWKGHVYCLYCKCLEGDTFYCVRLVASMAGLTSIAASA